MLLNPQKMQIFGISWIENEASDPRSSARKQWVPTQQNNVRRTLADNPDNVSR